jgi:hypothetical protein
MKTHRFPIFIFFSIFLLADLQARASLMSNLVDPVAEQLRQMVGYTIADVGTIRETKKGRFEGTVIILAGGISFEVSDAMSRSFLGSEFIIFSMEKPVGGGDNLLKEKKSIYRILIGDKIYDAIRVQ